MACKLITRLVERGQGRVISEREYDQRRITIGRGAANDVVLSDPGRVVSTRHAELRATDASWILLDMGSTNGTVLNGVRVTPRQEYALHDGDHIGLGPYEVVYHVCRAQIVPEVERYAAPPSHESPSSVSREPQQLLYLLRRLAGEGEWSSPEEMGHSLESRVRSFAAGYEPDRARGLVQSAKVAAQQSPDPEASMAVPPAASSPPPVSQMALERGRPLQSPAPQPGHVRGRHQKAREPIVRDDADSRDGHLARVLETMFSGLADAIRGRREFQKEFEVEATRILAWTPNAVKQAETAAEMETILLHPESQGLTSEQVIANLRDVFQDLTLHQLGLLAGFRECIRGLLKELDPQAIAKTGKSGSSPVGIGLLVGRNIKADAAAWKKYVETHRQLTEEEVKVFERILAPHFAQGYLSIHKKRRGPS